MRVTMIPTSSIWAAIIIFGPGISSHFTAMTPEELKETERLVNEAVFASYAISAEEMPIDAAREKGAMALFGEKYGDYPQGIVMNLTYL